MGEPLAGIDLDKALRVATTLEDEEIAARLRREPGEPAHTDLRDRESLEP